MVPTSPRSARPGRPGNPHEFNRAVAERYLSHVAATVKLLGRYGIYTLLDMHQDVYNTELPRRGRARLGRVHQQRADRAERRAGGRTTTANPQLQTAVQHFWSQRRGGQPPGQLRPRVGDGGRATSRTTAGSSATTPTTSPSRPRPRSASESTFTGQLECFYTGKAHTGFLANGATPLVCPSDVPNNGVIPTIQAVDHHHLIFVEPDIYWVTGGNIPSQLGPMPFQRLVFNFHVYCGDRSPVTGNPTNLLQCLQSEETAAAEQDITRLSMSSAYQSSGPAIFMSEFGATTSTSLVGFDAEWAGLDQLGWAYWAWKYYDDPTGSSAEGLVQPDGNYTPIVTVLSRTYPQAVAGDPNSVLFNPFTGAFNMVYAPTLAAHGVTTHRRRGVAALPQRVVRGGQGRTHHLAARCDPPHRADGRAPGAGLRLGDGRGVPVWLSRRPDAAASARCVPAAPRRSGQPPPPQWGCRHEAVPFREGQEWNRTTGLVVRRIGRRVRPGKRGHPQPDSNPCCRRERAVS